MSVTERFGVRLSLSMQTALARQSKHSILARVRMWTRAHAGFVLVAGWCMAATLFGGCASAKTGPRTCAMILLIDGKHVFPSMKQYSAIEQKVAPQFTRRGLNLVPEITSADLIATIECRVQPGAPEFTDLVVRDIASNTFIGRAASPPSMAEFPSLRSAEMEQEKARSGLTHPGGLSSRDRL